MPRKALAVLLVLSWIILSGFDLAEDLELPIQLGVHSSTQARLPGLGHNGKLVNNLLESGDRPVSPYAWLCELFAVQLSATTPTVFKRIAKIHKLYRVFLI